MNHLPFLCMAVLAAANIVVAPIAHAQPAAGPKPLEMSSGRLRVTFGPKGSLRLFADGVPVVTESHLYLVKQGWTGLLLNTQDASPTRTELRTENGVQVGIAEYENADAYARYRFDLRPDDSLTVRLSYGIKSGVPAQVEYAAGFVNANLLQARPYTADTVAGARTGTVPAVAAGDEQEKSRLTPFFKALRIQSPLGPLAITVAGNNEVTSSLNLFDARKGTQEWAVRHPIFWLGIGSPAQDVAPGDNMVSVTFALGSAQRRTAAPALAVGAKQVTDLAAARVPWSPDRPLIPLPKEVRYSASPLRLRRSTRIVLAAAKPTPEERRAAEDLRAELAGFWGQILPVVTEATAPRRDGDIVLGLGSLLHVDVPANPEGYRLDTNAGGATLAGYDPRGVYNAAQTLKQLLRLDEDGVYVKAAAIRDWPTLQSRGVHWYGGPNSWPFHERMISRIIAPLKYNEMVYEVENSRWKSQPGIYDDRSTPLDQVKKTVDHARAHLIEPIPLVNAFGHMEWLFVNKQNLDIAADPAHPYAVDPENPRTYEVLFGVMEEAVALFQPRRFHIGHDEVTLVGTFPKPGSKKSVTDLLIQNVNTIHNWLAKKNIRTMMWGDMLLHPGDEGSGGAAFAPSREESARRRAGIPTDIQMADWHYWANGLDYPSVAVLQKDGFEVLAAPWNNPSNISNFAQVAAREKARGLLQTTWAGWKMSVEGVKGESFGQFVAYLIAAEHAWNGGANDFDTLGYSPQDAFLSLWDRQPVDRSTRGGFTVDLAAIGNASGPQFAVSDRKTVGGIRYQIGKGKVVWLSGALSPSGAWPASVDIALGSRKAASLHWLWGTSFATPVGTTVANLTVTYADGKTAVVPVVYGKQISAFTDRRGSSETRSVGSGRSTAGEPMDLRDWAWQNPRPDVPITRITAASTATEAAPVLLGLTGIK